MDKPFQLDGSCSKRSEKQENEIAVAETVYAAFFKENIVIAFKAQCLSWNGHKLVLLDPFLFQGVAASARFIDSNEHLWLEVVLFVSLYRP